MKKIYNWTKEEITQIYNKPLLELVHEAGIIHRKYHDSQLVQVSTLISIKTGGCPEDCAYCPQAARYNTGVKNEKMLTIPVVKEMAENAKQQGSSRICMGAAWRNVKDGKEFEEVLEMVRTVNKMNMEVCCTLGMITENQAKRLYEAGLYAYNHNIDSSEEEYEKIITTRSYQDRLDTISNVRKTNIKVCSGGIIGMGESADDRISMLYTLAILSPQPESVPINTLVKVEGTPIEVDSKTDIFDVVRMIATARIIMPETQIRLSAGRTEMTREGQAMCFMAGANSIFAGEKLLTTPNPDYVDDMKLFEDLGLKPSAPFINHMQPVTIEAIDSQIISLGEKPRWSRPNLLNKNVD